jgi:hypothetical protein
MGIPGSSPLTPQGRRLLLEWTGCRSGEPLSISAEQPVFPVAENALRLAWVRLYKRAGITGRGN